jgi:hypothetical protein
MRGRLQDVQAKLLLQPIYAEVKKERTDSVKSSSRVHFQKALPYSGTMLRGLPLVEGIIAEGK